MVSATSFEEVAECPEWRAGGQGSGARGHESGVVKHSVHAIGLKGRKARCGWIEWIESREFDPCRRREMEQSSVWMDRMDSIPGG
jgi:hypothetical protein